MPISVRCECGKALRARDESAGKKVRCPGCGRAVAVPAGNAEAAAPPKPKGKKGRKRAGVAYVWTPPDTGLPAFVALTRDTLYLAPWVRTSKAEEAVGRLEDGEPPEEVFGRGDAIVPLNTITFVQVNPTLRQASVSYIVDGLQKQGS